MRALADHLRPERARAEVRRAAAPAPLFAQRAAQRGNCACGGDCPRCQTKLNVSSAPDDAHELEADRVAERVMRMPLEGIEPPGAHPAPPATLQRKCAPCAEEEEEKLLRKEGRAGSTPASAPAAVHDVLRSAGQPLDAEARAYLEPRFGHDFGDVRVHANHEAAESAREVGAQAYTVGKHVVFGAGQYAPASAAGRQLLAHELTHVLQQASARPGAAGVVQRKPTITIGQASSTPPKSKSERQAERSCPVRCCERELGKLHAMPLLYAAGIAGPVVKEGDPSAVGVSAALHFIRNEAERPAAGSPCHCDDFHIIQVVKTTHPTASRERGDSYVDVQSSVGTKPGETSPFYIASATGRRGEHFIPLYHHDEGEKVQTTESIYDTPHRTPAQLSANKTNLSWMGEACVACIKKNGLDRVLGCVTYGFRRRYDAPKDTYEPVVAVHPECYYGPSSNFIERLANDPLTMHYVFSTAPRADECKGGGGK